MLFKSNILRPLLFFYFMIPQLGCYKISEHKFALFCVMCSKDLSLLFYDFRTFASLISKKNLKRGSVSSYKILKPWKRYREPKILKTSFPTKM